jgi:uncharacterized protein (DUF4415 family)
MKNTVVNKTKTAAFSRKAVAAIRKEEAAAGIPEDVRFPKRYKIIPKDQRHEFPPEAFEARNTKVRISIYLDLDVLDYFKARAAAKEGVPYQTQINGELRALMEREHKGGSDPATQLREAKGLIDAALRKIS